jgi:cytosine/adenosine deaminase-related metal-dependent hydrolase/ubiquinone/menaquinone biosynthesis C-methylase UbiE
MSQLSPYPSELFDNWAQVYDTQPNPLLSLEQRILGSRLGDIRGLDILDAGCGTGRWLHRLVDRGPRSLIGVDISSAMLLLAGTKLDHNCDLRLGSCAVLPVGDTTIDTVLSSFVVSYLDDLDALAQEVDRVARPGATVFLSDMHPDTEARFNWKRGFQAGGLETHIHGRRWSLHQITQAFHARGFKVVSLMEPSFSIEERQIFEECGRLDLYESTRALPAIYVLQLRKPPNSARVRTAASHTVGAIHLTGGRCAVGADASALASLSIDGRTIHSIESGPAESTVDLSGFLLLPGLINAHDHLDFSLFPNIGDGPYDSAAEWARDIHSNQAGRIARYRQVPRSLRLWWGGIRNLLCGVTTVCHHNPLSPQLLSPGFPVRVVSDFDWAHSPSLEPDLASKYRESRADLPFIVHAAEGVDEKSSQEIFDLDRIRALDDRAVLVHGLGCTAEAVSLINRRRASVILCPTSNEFLFHRSPSLGFIRSLDSVVLGSDSPLTAAGDLLDEIRFVYAQTGLDANSIYSMVTKRPAEILRLRQGEGGIKPGSVADLVVVRDTGLSPAESLAQLTCDQIELVMVAGRIHLAGPTLHERLPDGLKQGLQRCEVNGHPRWIRAPIDRLITETEEFLGSDLCVGGKRVRRAPAP